MRSTQEQVHRLVGEASAAKASELTLLAELSQAFALSLDIEETLSNAADKIVRFLDAEAASVFLLDDSGQELECRAAAGPTAITGLRLPVTHGIVGRTLASGMCQMVRDVQADKDFTATVDQNTGFTTRSVMCTPLQVQKRVLGVLQVLNKKGEPGLFSEQDLNVLRVLGVAVSLAIHNAHMADKLVEQKRIQQELGLARELQQRLLPEPAPPGFPLHGINVPAYEVSGDFYDWLTLPDGRLGFTIGDVSGKGLNAALLMVRTTSLLRGLGRAETSLPALMKRVNAELTESSSAGMFVCALAGVYDPNRRLVSWCSAGFPAVLLHANGKFTRIAAESPPLGIDTDIEFPMHQQSLADGALYFYTDGATEVRTQDGLDLEESGLQSLIQQHANKPAHQRLQALVADLRQLKLRDDTTLLLLEHPDSRVTMNLSRLAETEFSAQLESLRDIRALVAEVSRNAGCGQEQVDQLVLALDEASSNVMRHAYKGKSDGRLILTIDRTDRQLEFRLRDFATRVDVGSLQPRSFEPNRPGGLGLQLINSIMDHWSIEKPDDGQGNLLVMTTTIR